VFKQLQADMRIEKVNTKPVDQEPKKAFD